MHYGCRKESVDPLDLCSLTKTHQSIGQKMDQMDELVEVYR